MTKRMGYLCIIVTTFIWAIIPVIFKALSNYTSNNIQNFVKFLVNFILLSIFAKLFVKEDERIEVNNNFSIWHFIFPALLIYLNNVFYIAGIAKSKANVASFIMEGIGPIITIIVFSLFIVEERKMIKKWYAKASILVALIGTSFVMVDYKTSSLISFDIGAFMVLIGAVIWSFFSLIVKKDFINYSAVIFSRNTTGICTMLFLITIIFTGEIFILPGINIYLFLGMILAGMVISVSSITFYKGIVAVPAVNANLIFLLGPIITVFISKFTLNETMTFQQIIGCILVLSANVLLLCLDFKNSTT